jgi:hypothetical protein
VAVRSRFDHETRGVAAFFLCGGFFAAVSYPELVDSTTTADHRYTPSNAKRAARKLDTQTMYESWRKAYRSLLKKRPNMSGVWYSQQIAKQHIAAGRNAETVRKQMKK